MNEIVFAPGSVPVAVAARVYGKDTLDRVFCIWMAAYR